MPQSHPIARRTPMMADDVDPIFSLTATHALAQGPEGTPRDLRRRASLFFLMEQKFKRLLADRLAARD